jgi:hypothetical protein
MKRPNDAVSALSKAIAVEPKHAQAHIGLGMSYGVLGRPDEAMREYETVRSLDAKLAEQLLNELNQSARAAGPSSRSRGPTPTAGQQPSPPAVRSTCPAVEVTGPEEAPDGQPVTFTVAVSGSDESTTPTFNWTVSAGTISSGQGTSTITVDTTGDGGSTIVAEVNVGGYAPECGSAAVLKAPTPINFGEYATADLSVNHAVLDEWILRLKQDPTEQGYVIAYGGRSSGPDDARRAGNNARNYAIEVHGVSPDRLFVAVGGHRTKPTVELWLRPRGGAEPPLTPTVDPKDVKPATRRR